jgi:hypothetical protein
VETLEDGLLRSNEEFVVSEYIVIAMNELIDKLLKIGILL